MRLTSSSSSQYPKFKNVGDRVSGTFVDFDEDRVGRFGAEPTLVLRSESGGEINVRVTTVLERILKENSEHLVPGAAIKIELTELIPTSKGSPMKMFAVDVEPPAGGAVIESTDEIPF